MIGSMAKTFSEQSDIDDRAKRILRERIEDWWTLRDRVPDVHVDYEIEHKCEGEPSALTAYVQLKGTRRINVSGGMARLQLKTKHLRYWVKARRPVMLVLVETSSGRSYFLFMQAWVLENQLQQELEKKSTLRVRIPLEQELKPDRFLRAVQEADIYLREQHPSSPAAAIAAAEQAWSHLDPRFQVALTATKDHNTYAISPKAGDPVSLKLTLTGLAPEQLRSAKSSLDWGRPCKLTTEKIKIEGSPLFEKIAQKAHQAELGFNGNRRSASVRLIVGNQPTQQLTVNGFLSAGAAGIAFTADEASPIRVGLEFPNSRRSTAIVSINLQTDPDAWEGRHLLSLTHLDQVARFSETAEKFDGLRLELWMGANRLLKPKRMFKSEKLFEALAWWFGLLREAVDAAVYFGIDPIVPKLDSLSDSQISRTWQAIRLARSGAQEVEFYDVNPSEKAKEYFSEGKVEARGFVKIAIPLEIDILARKIKAGFLHLEPVHGRIVRMDKTHGDEILRVFPTESRSFTFRHVSALDTSGDAGDGEC